MTPKDIEPDVSFVLNDLTAEIDARFFCPRFDHQLDRTLLGITSKAICLARAVCQLTRGGFYGEAFGLSRSSLEAFLIAKWISNKDGERRADSYVNFAKAHVLNADKVRQTHFSYAKRPSGINEQWIDEAAKFGNTKVWESAYNMATENYLDEREFNKKTGKPFEARFHYDGIYEKTSHWVHCGSLSLFGHMPEPGREFKVYRDNDDAEKGFSALSYSTGYLFMICIISFRHYGVEISPGLHKRMMALLRKIRSFLPKDRLVLGRPKSETQNRNAVAKRKRN
jgi:hypothetical protein